MKCHVFGMNGLIFFITIVPIRIRILVIFENHRELNMNFTITGYSTALFSTWYFIEEAGVLFDAGDGLTAGLMQKARKINHVFISHADRDHLTGLLQFRQLNARQDAPKIYYPKHCGSFQALKQFSENFDPQSQGGIWNGIEDNQSVQINKELYVKAIRNSHVKAPPDQFKSMGFSLYRQVAKLRQKYQGLSGEELRSLKRDKGEDEITELHQTGLIKYSGDTPVDDYQKWNNTKVLIHEATFLEPQELSANYTNRNLHSNIEEVMKMVSELNIETLVLGHFSSRYSAEQIDERIRKLCRELNIKIPVYRLLPGGVGHDILKGTPVNQV
mgnify:CR=1 FL=1